MSPVTNIIFQSNVCCVSIYYQQSCVAKDQPNLESKRYYVIVTECTHGLLLKYNL